MGLPGVERAITHKLLHRKRPWLFPMLDSVTTEHLGGFRPWATIWADLTRHEQEFAALEDWFATLASAHDGVRLTRLRIHDMWAASHCDVARVLGARMGLSGQVQLALRHLWERWDGKGMPGVLRGDQVPLAVRIMQVAQDADMAWQQGGTELAGRILAGRAGSGLDPQAVSAFLELGDQVYEGLGAPSVWEETMLAEPGPQPVLDGERLDACLSAIADFADLKSMWTVGHSRAVAQLAEDAAAVAGLARRDMVLLHRAALVHDIGRVAVPVNVWAKPGSLSRDEREQVRLHAYHSERVLDAAAGCARWPVLPGGMASAATGPATTGAVALVTCRSRPGCWRRRTATRRCASHGRTGRRCHRRLPRTSCARMPRRVGSPWRR
jgi:Family of unknown function (DUF6308)/HD domain